MDLRFSVSLTLSPVVALRRPAEGSSGLGTGWGRIARCFLRDVKAENVVGVDVNPDLLSVCRETFPGPRFLKSDPLPPLQLASQSVDFYRWLLGILAFVGGRIPGLDW